MNPLFSIIIPCYNQAHFLPDCLESLLQQSFPNWEAIVVNDGSTDTTSEVAKSYQNKDARIKLVEKENGGLSSARNFGIQSAQGNRFIFLDADDYLYPNCLIEISKLVVQDSDQVLIQYGYSYHLDTSTRHKALEKAIKKFGALGVFRKLDAVAKLALRQAPRAAQVFADDRDWVRDTHVIKAFKN